MLDGNSRVPVEENNEPEKQPDDSLQMVRLMFFKIQGCRKCLMCRLYNSSFRTMPFHGHLEAPGSVFQLNTQAVTV